MEDQRQEAAERLLQLLRGGEPSGQHQCERSVEGERVDDDDNNNNITKSSGHRRPEFALLETTAPRSLTHRSQHPAMIMWRNPSHVLPPPPLPPVRRQQRRFELPLVQGQFDDAPEPPKLPPIGGSALRQKQQQQQRPTTSAVRQPFGSVTHSAAVLDPIGKRRSALASTPPSVRPHPPSLALGAFRPVSGRQGSSSSCLRLPSESLPGSIGTITHATSSSNCNSNHNHITRLATQVQSPVALLQEPDALPSVAPIPKGGSTTSTGAADSRWVPIAPWPGTNPATATASANGHASTTDNGDNSTTEHDTPSEAARKKDSKRPGAAGRATVPQRHPTKRARVAAAAAAVASSRPPPLPNPALASLITSHPSPLLLPDGPGLPIPPSESSSTTTATDRSPIAPCALTERDILLGRGGQINRHQGNRTFRQVCDQYRMTYCTAKKGDKRRLAHQLALYFTKACGSRFLTKKSSLSSSKWNNHDDEIDQDDDCWYEVSLEKAALKCGQTLREGTAEMVRQTLQNQQQHLEQNSSSNNNNHAVLSAQAVVTDSSSQATVSGETNEKAKCTAGSDKERMTVTPSEEAAGGASSSRSLEQGA